jgi:hypothetical protein
MKQRKRKEDGPAAVVDVLVGDLKATSRLILPYTRTRRVLDVRVRLEKDGRFSVSKQTAVLCPVHVGERARGAGHADLRGPF